MCQYNDQNWLFFILWVLGRSPPRNNDNNYNDNNNNNNDNNDNNNNNFCPVVSSP